MLPARGLERAEDGADDAAADADEGDHDDEPSDGDGLRDAEAAAVLAHAGAGGGRGGRGDGGRSARVVVAPGRVAHQPRRPAEQQVVRARAHRRVRVPAVTVAVSGTEKGNSLISYI